ncbi:MAG: ATP-binding protein [Sciscionella sp.]
MGPVSESMREVLPAAEPAKMQRRRSGRVLAGVAGGLADHLDVPVLWTRLALVVLGVLGGAGIAAYAMLWLFVAQEPASTPVRAESGKERQQAFALVALGIAIAIGFSAISGILSPWVAFPIGVTLAGAAMVWREADQVQRRRSGVALPSGGRSALLRVLTGIVLVIIGIGVFLLHSLQLDQVQFALVAVAAALIGAAVLTVPWWLRLVRDLGEERRARIRTQERAEIAAHLHDSVLQTLALIQKQSEAPREVLRLARGQERQLRGWLYGPTGYSRAAGPQLAAGSLSAAVAAAAGEVEDTFAIKVDQVVVGDCEMDDKLVALVQACREAIVNAAKHASVGEVSVYAEVEPEQVAVFVRDRGRGFDPQAVDPDRHGLADSIRGRMKRNGGTVRLRTALGDGTEVQLRMPRSAPVST